MFVTRVEAAVSVMQVEASIRKIVSKFFKEYKLPMPKIKIANSLTSKWLGLCEYKGGDTNTTISIQKRITDDEKTLDRVLTHELIHHWEFLVLYAKIADSSIPQVQKALEHYTRKITSHGTSFLDWCTKINAVMGKDYVSEKSDSTYVLTSLDKDYYLLIAPSKAYNRYGWCWAVRPSAKQWESIKYLKEHCKAKLFKTRDDRYLSGAKISRIRLSLPHLGDEEGKIMSNYLKELYDTGKEVTF
jgi:hypothetical protein